MSGFIYATGVKHLTVKPHPLAPVVLRTGAKGVPHGVCG
jgi:hypothetical protein